MQGLGSQALIDRMVGAARLNVNTYEEVERDTNATTQALAVVVLASIAVGIGAIREDGFSGLIGGIISGIIGWVVFAVVVYFVGTRLLAAPGTQADTGQLLRTLGFSNSPRILSVVGFIPVLGPIVAGIASIWALVASIVAIRQALEMSTGRAIATAVVAFIALIIVTLIIAAIFGTAAFLIG
jgi:hypothetical protein